MAESFKICPICGATNTQNARFCSTCGTNLAEVDATTSQRQPQKTLTTNYDYRQGETDLYEGSLRRVGQAYLAGSATFLLILMVVGLTLIFGRTLLNNNGEDNSASGNIDISNTPFPTLNLPTVTEGPPTDTPSPTPTVNPTPTPTPTREPCRPTVQAGEGLYDVLPRCGHRFETLDIIDIVVELNGLTSAQGIREGQILDVPWPTETTDPNLIPSETPEGESVGDAGDGGDVVASVDDDTFDAPFFPTATLQPGITFHTVLANENIITIGVEYGANVEILSQLNPEITFSQCDFGLDFGGPRCTVFLAEGQRIRVPAPTPTPTIPPTASGSETPTPTATATFNAPSIISPSNRAVFTRDQFVTLRWIGSGTLADGQTYRLRVEDTSAGIVYTADTLENSFVLPDAWQGTDNIRHEYQWTVSVIDTDTPETPYFVTEPFTFIWQGRG